MPTPYYQSDRVTLYHGDSLSVLPTLDPSSIDAVVTDPPYGLSFMGKRWDYDVPTTELWAACREAMKPGAHLLAFAGTRTQHRMCVRIEDAGFDIRDMIAWVYGSGFPKSLNVSKAIDKAAGAEREVVGTIRKTPSASSENMNDGWKRPWAENHPKTMDITAPATASARKWSGWGTALKPAMEPITVARKPLVGTVAENVQEWGTGAINVDGGRVGTPIEHKAGGLHRGGGTTVGSFTGSTNFERDPHGRWPANLIHDGGENATAPMGTASRFFYCAKASKADRDDGVAGVAGVAGVGALRDGGRESKPRMNFHPTVKPTDLMRYLCRLVTQPDGLILDPFLGSGSTGKAAIAEGFRFVGIERDEAYCEIAAKRIQAAEREASEIMVDT